MSKTSLINNRGKPKTDEFKRKDFTELFVDVLKICEPDHPTYDRANPYNIVSVDKIKTSYCRNDSKYIARCMPLSQPYVAKYSIDLNYYQNSTFESVLATTVHEATHIPIGSHSNESSSTHPPEFWNEMAYHTQCVIDNIEYLKDKWGDIDIDEFKNEVYNDPNSQMVDNRSDSVSKVQNRFEKWIVNYP